MPSSERDSAVEVVNDPEEPVRQRLPGPLVPCTSAQDTPDCAVSRLTTMTLPMLTTTGNTGTANLRLARSLRASTIMKGLMDERTTLITQASTSCRMMRTSRRASTSCITASGLP